MRTIAPIAASIAVAMIASACLGGCCTTTPRIVVPDNATEQPPADSDARVTITASGFEPRTVTIKAGDTVAWTNVDSAEHNVGGSGLVSGVIGAGESFAHTFEEPGTYQYLCTLHPDSAGQVVVASP